jgi:hypothetical protein
VSGHSPSLYIEFCPATVKSVDVCKTLQSLLGFNIVCPRGEILVPVSVPI